jgi:hypothetical protein
VCPLREGPGRELLAIVADTGQLVRQDRRRAVPESRPGRRRVKATTSDARVKSISGLDRRPFRAYRRSARIRRPRGGSARDHERLRPRCRGSNVNSRMQNRPENAREAYRSGQSSSPWSGAALCRARRLSRSGACRYPCFSNASDLRQGFRVVPIQASRVRFWSASLAPCNGARRVSH